jgi:hypothetical protein
MESLKRRDEDWIISSKKGQEPKGRMDSNRTITRHIHGQKE